MLNLQEELNNLWGTTMLNDELDLLRNRIYLD